MKTKLPVIYEYNNFRSYLSDYQSARNAIDPAFTKSSISRILGLPNTRSFFFDVVKGKKISSTFIDRFIKVLELTKDEARFFRVLVMFNQAESAEERELYFDQLISLNRTPKRVIGNNIYSFYKNWYNSVIRALLDIYDFKDNYSDLAKKVFPVISVKQAKEAIVLLKKLGLIAKNQRGFYKPTEQSIATPDYVKDELIKQYQLSCFEMVKQSLVKTPSGPQTISTNVISISNTAYKRIEKKIEKFRSEIRSLVHKDEKPAERVYQLDIALFPNSKELKISGGFMKKILLICIVLFFVRCTEKVAGTTNETNTGTKAMVSGILFEPDGKTPAKAATVSMRKKNTLADTGQAASSPQPFTSASVTTDRNGKFAIDTIDTGLYIIEGIDGANNVVLIDSIKVKSPDSTKNLGADTLLPAGVVKGVIKLTEGGDPRKVFVLAFGLDRFALPDAQGNFTFPMLAKGKYSLRFLPSLENYGILDTTGVPVSSGDTTNLDTIVLPFKGIPSPKNLVVSYDTLKQTVILSWGRADTSLITGYNIYRSDNKQNFNRISQTPVPKTTTIYYDSSVTVGGVYEYRVVSLNASGNESSMGGTPGDTVKIISSSQVTTTMTWTIKNTISDTASINDTVKFILNFQNPTRKISQVNWFVNRKDSVIRQSVDSSLAGKDSLAFSWNKVGENKVYVNVVDASGTVWADSDSVCIIQDVPQVKISSDTAIAINTPMTFLAKVTQKFGYIVKYSWDNGIVPGTYITGDSVYTVKYLKEGLYTVTVVVTDDDGNVNSNTKNITVTNDAPTITGLKDTTISIKDTVPFSVSAHDTNGIMQKYYWNFGDGSAKQFDTTKLPSDSHVFPSTAMQCTIGVSVADSFGKLASRKALVNVLQDAPVITFISRDTVIDHGGTVQCSTYVQQQFGTMTVEIDTANNGIYKSLGSLGIYGGKTYSFATGNACSWDSVKFRITDDDGNIEIRGFKIDIRPQPLTIISIDSTVNTITVHFSQSQETDFAQYRIYRNTTSAVDTNSELWATISTAGTTSYTTPSPGFAWNPRYYRVYQKDKEGLWSIGSNVVYGCIINSPPNTPVISYPTNDADTIWPSDMVRWHHSIDPNGNGVRYKVLVNFNNNGYNQFQTNLQDTFVQLSGLDSLSLKYSVIAYDTLGDSSTPSEERTAIIICRPITDMSGNIYHTVKIGTQIWTVENLKTTRYNDNTLITLVTDNVAWINLTTPGYCWYNNDLVTYGSTYGALYNGYAVNTGKLAPKGWHVPTDSEWGVLTTYLGGIDVAGGKLKESGTIHWLDPNVGATNETGFTALPSGYRSDDGTFTNIGNTLYWWSTTAYSATYSWIRFMYNIFPNVYRTWNANIYGFSVRCIRDP